jgi:hypothetical protein
MDQELVTNPLKSWKDSMVIWDLSISLNGFVDGFQTRFDEMECAYPVRLFD